MKELADKITEKTLIPISLVISVIGAVMWMTVIFTKVEAAEKLNEQQDRRFDFQMSLLVEIKDRLIRLEERKGCK